MNVPIDPKEKQIESLLAQLPLAEPSTELDQRMRSLFDSMPVQPTRSTRTSGIDWRWSRLIGGTTVAMATVATLLFFLNLPVANSKELLAFKKMHGHSGQQEYSECSACHSFSSSQEQVLEKWLDVSLHNHYEGNCNFCHVDAGFDPEGKMQSNSPKRSIAPNADLPSGERSFDHWHGHSKNVQFKDCAECHRSSPEPPAIETRKLHWDPETNCSMCHTAQDRGATP